MIHNLEMPRVTLKKRNAKDYVVPMRMVVRKRVTSLRSILKTPFSGSFSASSRT